ncbi:bleomycin resistance protein [Sulfurovum riftiae]|uniref:Bleomycin resistance protein n=2 Tax=Sulfurovum riftiae TaxID=1630136 RepID=A0A151CEQ5_9BACT|nr:bleomycin resistance protein [Sulfurovum riftiae]
MEITLNHTIINAKDNVASAKFYERIFGFTFIKEWGHFAVLKVNSTLTFDFLTKEKFSKQHYAFKVTEAQFDAIFERIRQENIPYGSDPYDRENGTINHHYGGRGVYFPDPNGHILEIITADYILD